MTSPATPTECERWREALSARIDGEDSGPGDVDAHLASCAACRAWMITAATVTRSLRLQPAEPVPDLTASILAAVATERAARPPSTGPAIVRLTLALVAAAQVMLAVPALLGNDLGAPIHVAHEQGAWALALAALFGLAAWRPARAAAAVPLLSVFVGALIVFGLPDVLAGRAAPTGEMPHLMAAFGLALLWLESHPGAWSGWPAAAAA